ncbi:MAG: bifunctional ornithine acetyltransferase/N-acetylglutamate synthase [Oscillospiraceae bacterium]|nr:bifunctional ornithine acetyltransferase/N-acetylglutamate synthase [Oscillospiraceae bacterium]
MELIKGGICAAKGFQASGVHCGIRKNKTKKDLALIVSQTRAAAAATYTTNLVKGAPIAVTKANISDGYAQAVICNSGNANTCNANGTEIAQGMCALVEQYTGISAKDVVVASTGVIGQQMTLDPIADGMQSLVDGLGENSKDAAHAIMTTDTQLKEVAVSFEIGGKVCSMGGIAKGSGMIHPNMATMLCFLTTDTAITPEMLQKALSATIVDTFNMISIDGDTSTNDMVVILANGMAENPCISEAGEDFDVFCKALKELCTIISKKIAADGEGATKLLVCSVSHAETDAIARTVSKSVICSSLLKAAMFGADANWGRVLCAIGYSGAPVDIHKIDVQFHSDAGSVLVCKDGMGTDFSEPLAKEVLMRDEISIDIDLKSGDACASAFGCDLTYDYVKINGDYRT